MQCHLSCHRHRPEQRWRPLRRPHGHRCCWTLGGGRAGCSCRECPSPRPSRGKVRGRQLPPPPSLRPLRMSTACRSHRPASWTASRPHWAAAGAVARTLLRELRRRCRCCAAAVDRVGSWCCLSVSLAVGCSPCRCRCCGCWPRRRCSDGWYSVGRTWPCPPSLRLRCYCSRCYSCPPACPRSGCRSRARRRGCYCCCSCCCTLAGPARRPRRQRSCRPGYRPPAVASRSNSHGPTAE